MTRVRTAHQLDGLITLDNVKQIAIFTDFDSAVLFRQHHPAWEVHIHLVLARAPSALSLQQETFVQDQETAVSAYLTDGETIYKQAVFTQEQLGLENAHAQDETDGLLYWECHSPRVAYQVVEEVILQNPVLNESTYNMGIS